MFLNNHTYYSLRYGTLSTESLVDMAATFGIESLAITDINNGMGIHDFIYCCREKGIKPIAGMEFRKQNNDLLYIGLARNNQGFKELNDFISRHNLESTPLPDLAPAFNDVYVIYPYGKRDADKLSENEFTGVRASELTKLQRQASAKDQSKMCMLSPVSFATKDDLDLHRQLRAIDNNCLLTHLPPDQLAAPDEVMMPPAQLLSRFEHFPALIQNTLLLSEQCHINFDYAKIKNKSTFTGDRYDDRILLEKLALDGLKYRYGKSNSEASKRVRHELEIIDRLGYSAYFLIAWDVIRYSMSRGFYHVGRGSGANSMVAYCLRITDVDPIELNLYFERFLNPKRSSPPDFDIDYSWKERDEVIDYIFKRYGREHTALLGATSTFKGRSILRELGKVHGLPKNEIDDLVRHPEAKMNENHITRHIVETGRKMTDFPNLRSIHAGGILISEEPITCYTALDMPPKGFPTTQWDMYTAEKIGFEKLDILSQRGIGHINDSVELILENKGKKVDVHQVAIFKNDPEIKRQLRSAETIGCFYIESPAMRGLLTKLRCDDYLTLVAASSIVRPGVAKSGMMREYIYRFHNPDKFQHIHPVMEEQLKETFGVMVYQEDVLKVCHHFAGLDLADADVLRRAMSGKFRGKKEFQRIVDKFFENCRERGYPEDIAKEVWRQIESFSGYSFSKAHSASYAVESFQSLFLKTYYPLEFMVAVINNFGGFYTTWVYVNEARRLGGTVELPCVNRSKYKTCISGDRIWLGMVHIANLEQKAAYHLLDERKLNGDYLSISDFMERTGMGTEQVRILIRCGAFRFTGKSKAQLLWEASMLAGKKDEVMVQNKLFHLPAKDYKLPELVHHAAEDAYDEIELLGFPVTLSYFDLLKTSFRGEMKVKEMIHNVGKYVRMVGHLAAIKYVKTSKGGLMHFGTFIDPGGEVFDTTHFPASLKNYPYRGSGVYLLYGQITEEFGYATLNVEKQAKLPITNDPREE